MKKLTVLILLLAGIFLAPQVIAQVDSQDKAKDQKTEQKDENKSGDKSVPAVQSSKNAPGTATSGSSSKSKGSKGDKGTVQSSGMTSANAPKTGKMFDAKGNLLMTIDQGGWIRNPKNRLLGQYTQDGQYYTKNRALAGTVENGVIRDRNGKIFARISQDGKITDASGNLMGTVNADGTVLDSRNAKIGSSQGVEKNVAAIMFFFAKPSQSGTAGSSRK